jgi:hypothetical protein
MTERCYRWLLPLPLAGLTLTDWRADHRVLLAWVQQPRSARATVALWAIFESIRLARAA